MSERNRQAEEPDVLDVVALLVDIPAEALSRGQVGTAVEALGPNDVLVEFSDDDGRAYSVVPCRRRDLLVLHYARRAA